MTSPGFFSGLETLEVVTCSSLDTVLFAPQRDANGITSVYYWNKRRKWMYWYYGAADMGEGEWALSDWIFGSLGSRWYVFGSGWKPGDDVDGNVGFHKRLGRSILMWIRVSSMLLCWHCGLIALSHWDWFIMDWNTRMPALIFSFIWSHSRVVLPTWEMIQRPWSV